jgi:putative addiction module component (TIGR02574 family)
LWGSLDGLSEAEIEELWADEAVRRVELYRAGKIDTYPAEEVHQRILDRLK